MGSPTGAIGTVLSLGAAGVKMYGDYETSRGVKAGDTYRSEELQRAAEYGDLKATQVNAQMTRNLAISLGKLDSIRAASHTNPFDPTNTAVRDFSEQVGAEQKTAKVTSILEQKQQDEADAAYMRFAGNEALLAGDTAMWADALSGLSGAASSFRPNYNQNYSNPLPGSSPLGQGGIGST